MSQILRLMILMNIIKSIQKNEGFRASPYIDTTGNLTIGYGTKLPITKVEATLLLEHRLNQAQRELYQEIEFYHQLPEPVRDVLIDMAYNLGINGLLKFKKMLKALKKGNWEKAADEGLDSRWHKQVGKRAERLMNVVRNIEV